METAASLKRTEQSSSVPPPKKQKQNDTEVIEASSGNDKRSAVTALAASKTVVFSGHRDGTISKWKLEAAGAAAAAPVWTIVACTNLTQHELYGKLALLGVAGLALRRSSGDNSKSMLLYSWNHQREDMRPTNGIPQKIMIWKCESGERQAALMIDVGRSSAGVFANPLVSCMLFCKLQVTKPAATKEGDNEASAVESVWVDSILVGVLATCDPPPEKVQPTLAGAAPAVSSQAASGKAAAAEAMPTATATSTSRVAVTTTGNLLPFHEQSRQRMAPWIARDGFVRALASVPGGRYVVSVSETSHKKAAVTPHEDSAANGRSNIEQGGETNELVLWDAAHPGTVLHRLDIYSSSRKEWMAPSSLRGSIYGIAYSGKQHLLLTFGKQVTFVALPETNAEPRLTFYGSTRISALGTASAGFGDNLAVATNGGNPVSLYSVESLRYAAERSLKAEGADNISLPKLQSFGSSSGGSVASTTTNATAVALQGTLVVAGFQNGAVSCEKLDANTDDTDDVPLTCCSTAAPGLVGQLCPHLSPNANSSVQLKNECIIQ